MQGRVVGVGGLLRWPAVGSASLVQIWLARPSQSSSRRPPHSATTARLFSQLDLTTIWLFYPPGAHKLANCTLDARRSYPRSTARRPLTTFLNSLQHIVASPERRCYFFSSYFRPKIQAITLASLPTTENNRLRAQSSRDHSLPGEHLVI